jgi:hypothetical protein
LSLALGALFSGCPGEDHEDHAVMPEKLKAAGFLSDLDAGLKKAKAESKFVLLYITPSWFT